jgi:hypothetical protein
MSFFKLLKFKHLKYTDDKIIFMEKIQIPVNVSEYKVYYDYCLKYYQVHDTVRKQSIHAFLDLYVKGIIPVENQDIQQVHNLFAGKCNELKKEQNAPGMESTTTMLFQLRVCSDILIFIEDLEKMYRLIVKKGIVADYLLILGTFSKIIDEDESSHFSVKYDLKDEVIKSLAYPLAEIIRKRLGNTPLWNSVVRELIGIATQFNRQSSELKFDVDILKLIAPAVVAFFHKDIPSRKILVVLPSYFEEHELDEFETILRMEPGQHIEQDANINWETIRSPLEVVASAVELQRYQWSQGIFKISDQYSLTAPSGMPSHDGGHYPVTSPSPTFLAPMHADGLKTFDIVVSPDIPEQVMTPFQEYPQQDKAPVKTGLMQFIPIIIGVAVILIIISAGIFFSGYLDHPIAIKPINSTKNSTSILPTGIQIPIKTATPTPTPQKYSSYEIGSHLLEIAFGPDNEVIKKSTKDRLVVSLVGLYNKSDVILVNTFIGQFNNLSTTTKISENIRFDGPSDITVDLSPPIILSQINNDLNTTVYIRDLQTGSLYFVYTPQKTVVNSDLKGNERKRWILRAYLYNLGFYGETAKYSDSLFYAGANNASQMNDVDIKALQLMYGRKISNGMKENYIRDYLM